MTAPLTLSEVLAASPALFPLNIDPTGNLVQLVNLAEADYESASFLDGRLLGSGMRHAVVPWSELENAAVGLPRRCNFIFHISHAGSTLLSRLLGSHESCFSLREPGILRLLGQGAYLDRLDTFQGLWSRTFHPEQTALIKATSFVSEIAVTLLSATPNSKALLMYVPPETFLPALLDGAMSDITSQSESRLQRLQLKGLLNGLELSNLSIGECVAMSWLSEMASLAEAAKKFPGRTTWMDFDQFLNQPEFHLLNAFAHFGVHTEVASLISGSMMQRYAKKPEVIYDASFRTKLLAKSQQKFSVEISRGLAWLELEEQAAIRSRLPVTPNRY